MAAFQAQRESAYTANMKNRCRLSLPGALVKTANKFAEKCTKKCAAKFAKEFKRFAEKCAEKCAEK